MDCTRRPTGGALRPGQLAWLNHTGESDDDRLSLLLQLSTIEPPLTYTTRSHDVVRRWARERGAQPALRRETSAGVVTHRLAFAFRADEEEHSLRRIGTTGFARSMRRSSRSVTARIGTTARSADSSGSPRPTSSPNQHRKRSPRRRASQTAPVTDIAKKCENPLVRCSYS